MRVLGLRKSLLLPGILVVAAGLCAWWPKGAGSGLREVSTDTLAHFRGRTEYRPTIQPGTYAWTSSNATAAPIGTLVRVYDYGNTACVVNEDGHDSFRPAREPNRILAVRPEPGLTAVRWNVGLHRMDKGYGDFWAISRLGDKRHDQVSAGVPFHSAYIGSGDIHSAGFVGCSAVVLTRGDSVIFAHCLSGNGGKDGRVKTAFTVQRVWKFLEAQRGDDWKEWTAHIAAGTPEDASRIQKDCKERGIEVSDLRMIGTAGHDVFWCSRTKQLSVVPRSY